ncbi:MAG TPA: hypothetical protein VMU62_08240, partial [Acidobacteriaceae bacterium]|nr:hypothetical protein [Acidobacteriaceae bacterium]
MRTDAALLLGWRLGVRTNAFGPLTFFEAAAKADAAGLAAVEGVSSQQVSKEIPKKLDYNLTPNEIVKVKDRLDELRLQMPAYYVDVLPADVESRRKIFEFAKKLGAGMVVVPAEPASFEDLDNLASETGMNVAVRTSNPQAAASALKGLSSHIGLSVDLAVWQKSGMNPVVGLDQLKGRLLAADLHDIPGSMQFLHELSRLQPPSIQANWPPTRDGGAKRSPGKPIFLALDPANGDLSQAADAYDKAVVPALAYRIDTLSQMQTISSPDAVPEDVRAKIDAAIPRKALVQPAKPRKLLVMDLCVDGGYYHA